MAKLQGAKIGDYHTLTDWGLYLKVGSPKISSAEVDEYLVQVPGRPKKPGRPFTAGSQTPSMANGFNVSSTMTHLSTGRACGACP